MIYKNEVKVIQFYDYMYTETRECGQILNNYVHLTICLFLNIFFYLFYCIDFFKSKSTRRMG